MRFPSLSKLSKLDIIHKHMRMVKKKKHPNTKKSAVALIAQLGSESNAHGLAKIASTKKTRRKVMWSILVILGFTAAAVQLSLLVRKYLDRPVVEVSKIRYGMPVEFPAITVCNNAAVSLTKAKQRLASNDSHIGDWFNFTMHFQFGKQIDRISSLQSFYENLDREAELIGHDIDHFLLHCRFNKEPCSAENFTSHFDGSNYYNCFTFNSGQQKEKLLMHATGPQNGLSMIFSLDNDDPPIGSYGVYNIKSNIENAAGVRVVVHASNTMPFPVDHGFDVPPGYSTSVSLKASLHTRLGSPFGNCSDDVFLGNRAYKHTIFACLQLCRQQIVINTCGCRSSSLPDVIGQQNLECCGTVHDWLDYLRHPKSHDKTVKLPKMECEERVLKMLANDRSYEKACECYQPCSEVSFQKAISLSYWPLEFYQYDALKILFNNSITQSLLKEAYEYLSNLTYDDRDKQIRASNLIRQNLVRVNIYLEDLSVVEFHQMPAYEIADFFADIGGTFGLWMGISVLTIMELIELIISLICLLFHSERKIPDHEPMQNGNIAPERDYAYERTLDTDPETPV